MLGGDRAIRVVSARRRPLSTRGYRDAAEASSATGQTTTVLAYIRNPEGLDFYLDGPVRTLEQSEVDRAVCESEELVAFVTQPFGIPDVVIPCLDRAGTRHFRCAPVRARRRDERLARSAAG